MTPRFSVQLIRRSYIRRPLIVIFAAPIFVIAMAITLFMCLGVALKEMWKELVYAGPAMCRAIRDAWDGPRF